MDIKPPKLEKEVRLKVGIYQGDGTQEEYEAVARLLAETASFDPVLPFLYGSAPKLTAAAKALNLNDPSPLVQKQVQDVKGRRVQVVSVGEPTEEQDAYTLLECAVQDIRDGNLRALVTLPVSEENFRTAHPDFKNVALSVAQACGGGAFRMLLGGGDLRLNFLTSVQRADAEQYLSVQRVEQRLRDITKTLKSDFAVHNPRIAVLSAGKDLNSSACIQYDEETLKPLLLRLREEGLLAFGPYPAKTFLHSPDLHAFDAVLCMYKEQMETGISYFHPYDLRYYTAGIPVVHIEPFFADLGKEDAFRSLYRSVCMAIDIDANRTVYRKITENPLPYRSMASGKRERDNERDNERENGVIEETKI